jgi:hypothetical protein
MTAASLWIYYDGAWSKIADVANLTFTASILSITVIVDWPVGERIACALTLSANAVTVHAYPLESMSC